MALFLPRSCGNVEVSMDPVRALAVRLAASLRGAGFTAYFAGGCVRDRLRGCVPKDYDIATNARPEEVLALFPRARSVGAHFGVMLVHEEGSDFEIATFRTDGSYRDGRHPEEVAFAGPEEDARRRDFTINGLFEDPLTGEIIDFVEGRTDLENRVIRAIGEAARRFEEDHLRLLRAVRFATVLDGFTIEAETWEAMRAWAPHIRRIVPERVRAELDRCWAHPNRVRAFDLLVESGLMREILPEIIDLQGCEQPPQWHPEGDVFVHTRLMIDLLPPEAPLPLVWAVLLHDIGKPATFAVDPDGRIRFSGHDQVGAGLAEEILRRLRYPNELTDQVVPMVARHMQFMNVQDMRVAKLKRFMASPTFEMELELHRVDCASSNGFTDNYEFLLEKRQEFARQPLIPPPLVNGHDLIALGRRPGPEMGALLRHLQTLQLEGTLTDREQALEWVRKARPEPEGG